MTKHNYFFALILTAAMFMKNGNSKPNHIHTIEQIPKKDSPTITLPLK